MVLSPSAFPVQGTGIETGTAGMASLEGDVLLHRIRSWIPRFQVQACCGGLIHLEAGFDSWMALHYFG